MIRKTRHIVSLFAIAPLVVLALSGNALADSPEAASATGRFWYESGDGEDVSYSMDLTIVDGIAIRDELVGGKRVKVLLVADPLDREKFMEVLNDARVLMFATTRLHIDEYVQFDVCSNDDGSDVEICGIHFSGPGLSKSSSGFGVYGGFTESVRFADGRVSAELKTATPEEDGNVTYGIDLEFDLSIVELEAEE